MEMEWIKSIELIAMATGDGPFLNEIKSFWIDPISFN